MVANMWVRKGAICLDQLEGCDCWSGGGEDVASVMVVGSSVEAGAVWGIEGWVVGCAMVVGWSTSMCLDVYVRQN